MKTVNLIFIAIVTFLANTAQAQSVEETEQWLNEYGKEITLSYTTTEDDFERKGSLNFKGFDGEYLNFLRSSNDSRGGSYRQIYKVLPKDILYQDLSAFSEKDFEENNYIKTKDYLLKAKSGTVLHSGKATNGFNEDRSEIN